MGCPLSKSPFLPLQRALPGGDTTLGHWGKEHEAHQERGRDSGGFSLRKRRGRGDLGEIQLLQGAEGNLWSRWSQSCGRCPRAGQKLEHRKLQLSKRQVYLTMGVEQIVEVLWKLCSLRYSKLDKSAWSLPTCVLCS